MKSLTIRTISYSVKLAVIVLMTVTLLPLMASEGLCQGPESVFLQATVHGNVWLGEQVQVFILFENSGQDIGRFDLLIEYPPWALTFEGASEGELLTDCEWEMFWYQEVDTNLIHLSILADIEGDGHDPTCLLAGEAGLLAGLSFTITEDSTAECHFLPVNFYWQECTDNHVRLADNETCLVSHTVRTHDWVHYPPPDSLPSYGGIPDSCLGEIPCFSRLRLAYFTQGGVDVLCSDYIDDRGDLNLNNISNEIADWVLYAQYFMYGLSVFVIDLDAQVATTDINNDGLYLTFRDIVYLYRVIIGHALPYPEPPVKAPTETATFEQDILTDMLSVTFSGDSLAGAFLIFDDSVTPTCLHPTPAWFDYYYDGNETRVLFQADFESKVGSEPIITIDGPGVLVEAHTTDFYDSEIATTITIETSGVDIDFVVGLVEFIFAGGPLPSPEQYTDADCSGEVDIDDVVWVILYIFAGGPAPGDC